MKPGLLCPRCSDTTEVLDSRPTHAGMTIRRRRRCLNAACAYRFSTKESATDESIPPDVVTRGLELLRRLRKVLKELPE